MRELTDNEKEFIKNLISLKREAKLEELQVAKFLRRELECFALKWTTEPQKNISFYSTEEINNSSTNWAKLKSNYFHTVDLLYFIEELEHENFIKTQSLPYEIDCEDDRILYDRSSFQYNHESDNFLNKNGHFILIKAKHNVYIDFVSYLERYANKVIYPLPLLEDFAQNNFKTINQRNFENQQNKTKISLSIASIALIVSALSPFIEIICSPPTQIDRYQLKTIEKAILHSKTILPDTFNVKNENQPKQKTTNSTVKQTATN